MLPENRRERFTAYAETLQQRFRKGILKNLQDTSLRVVWKREEDKQGNIHKRPFPPKGYPASIYKPRQWASVDTVLEALATGNFAGIGFMLPAPFVLIDLDAKQDAPMYDPANQYLAVDESKKVEMLLSSVRVIMKRFRERS